METEILIKNSRQIPINQERIEKAVLMSLLHENFQRPAEISILFIDDIEMHKLNKEYRNIDKPTDVLSFSMIDDDDLTILHENVPIGDIVISFDTAMRQASALNRSVDDEIDLLVIHGMLHLLGYDDSTDDLADIMRIHEKGILEKIE